MDDEGALGLLAKRRGVPDGTPLVVGSGRGLKGRVAVTDPEQAARLFPGPSQETIDRIRHLEAGSRWIVYRMAGLTG